MKAKNNIAPPLKKSDVQKILLLSEAKKEITRLQRKNAKLEITCFSQKAEIAGLKNAKPQINIQIPVAPGIDSPVRREISEPRTAGDGTTRA